MDGDTSIASLFLSGEIYTVLNALQSTKYLAVACFALLVYDYFLTLEREVKLFWRPGLTITRVLFFMNRYLPPINFIVVMSWFFREQPSHDFCYGAMISTATFTVFELIIMQAILVARVVHLWTWRQNVQRFILVFFLMCVITVTIMFGLVMKDTGALSLPFPLTGCFDTSDGDDSHLYWTMLVPTFVMETLLVIMTVVRIIGPLQKSEYKNKLLKLLMKDGLIFYSCVCVSVGFDLIGSAMWENPKVSFPAIFSGFLPVILSICASRLLFNLHELAEELVGHPTFALNTVELGRLNLKKGPRRGEFIVEVGGGAMTDSQGSSDTDGGTVGIDVVNERPKESVSERGREIRKSWFGRREKGRERASEIGTTRAQPERFGDRLGVPLVPIPVNGHGLGFEAQMGEAERGQAHGVQLPFQNQTEQQQQQQRAPPQGRGRGQNGPGNGIHMNLDWRGMRRSIMLLPRLPRFSNFHIGQSFLP